MANGRPDAKGEFEFSITITPVTEDGERTWNMECDAITFEHVLLNVDVEADKLFRERGWVGDGEPKQQIHVTVKYDYYEGIPSGDRGIQPDPPEVEWYFECDDKEFHRRVLDAADQWADEYIYERVCRQEEWA